MTELSKNTPLIFICHTEEDIKAARDLYKNLKQAGFSPWLDEIDVLPGRNRDMQIENAMKSADFALVCLSQFSIARKGYLNEDIKWIMDHQDEMPEDKIFMIPVKLDECDLQERFYGIRTVNLFEPGGFERLTNALEYQLGKNTDSYSERINCSGPNPFYYGGVVPTRLFYGRKEVLQAITSRISSSALQSVSIVSETRMGKSSLLVYFKNEIFKRLPKSHNYLVIYLDLMKAYCHARKGLMRALRRELTKKWREPWPANEDDNLEAFDFAVEDMQNDNIRLILCLDEVENLIRRPDEFDDLLEDWRANGSMGQIAMVTTSAQSLADLCREHKLRCPFFNIFNQTTFGLLEPDEWKSLLRDNMTVTRNDLRFVEKTAGGHPLFTQMAAYHLWEMKADGYVDYEQLKKILKQEMTPNLKYLWQKLSSAEQMALLSYTGSSDAKPDNAVLSRLTQHGILRNDQPFSQAFTEFLLNDQP